LDREAAPSRAAREVMTQIERAFNKWERNTLRRPAAALNPHFSRSARPLLPRPLDRLAPGNLGRRFQLRSAPHPLRE
jgi:hypothetical protein